MLMKVLKKYDDEFISPWCIEQMNFRVFLPFRVRFLNNVSNLNGSVTGFDPRNTMDLFGLACGQKKFEVKIF